MQAKIRLGIIYALLTIFGLFMIVPFIWMISTSLMTQSEFNKQEAVFVPKEEYHVWNTDAGQRRILVVQAEKDSTVIHVLNKDLKIEQEYIKVPSNQMTALFHRKLQESQKVPFVSTSKHPCLLRQPHCG